MQNKKSLASAAFTLRNLLIAGGTALLVVLIGGALFLLVMKVVGNDQSLSAAEQEKALAQINAYSAEVEAGTPSREKTEFIAVVLVVLGDGEITKDEVREVKHLYDQVNSNRQS